MSLALKYVPDPLDGAQTVLTRLLIARAQTQTRQQQTTRQSLFEQLPPEIQYQIWLDSELTVPVEAVRVCRALAPFARANLFRVVRLDSVARLKQFATTCLQHPGYGALVKQLQFKEDSRSRVGFDTAWLNVLNALTRLDSINIHSNRLELLLSPTAMSCTAFQTARILNLSSDVLIEFSGLRHLHLSSSLRQLRIGTPIKFRGGPSRGLFESGKSRISTLAIESEPHAADFTALLEHLSLTDLVLKSTTTDAQLVFELLGPRTKRSLRRLSFTSEARPTRRIEATLQGFQSLERLHLWSTQLDISPEFLHGLQGVPLVSLAFNGPQATCVGRMLDWLNAGHHPSTLSQVEVNVSAAASSASLRVDQSMSTGRMSVRTAEEDLNRLRSVCTDLGITVASSVKQMSSMAMVPRMPRRLVGH
ncbi:hypothetical protein ACM66B_000627 [Microbotryomycetes sp. NB124-2]